MFPHVSCRNTADQCNVYGSSSYFPHIPFTEPMRWTRQSLRTSGFSCNPQHLASDVEPKMEELREPVHLFLLKSQFFGVRGRICGGDDAEPRWRNRGDGAHICFCSASSSVLRKRACRAGFTGEWTLCSPSQPAALLALGQ